MRSAGSVDRLDLSVSAVAGELGHLREAARAFAQQHGVERPQDVALAIGEAVANAVLHAYHGREVGHVRMTGALDGRRVVFGVEDGGSGLRARPDSPGLGLGLPIIAQVADLFEVRAAARTGTSVSIGFTVPS